MNDKTAADYLKELSGLSDYLAKVQTQITGAEAHLARLKANAEELDKANRQAADALAFTNAKVVEARKQADSLAKAAQSEANDIINRATAEAAKAKADWNKEVSDKREKLRAIVG
jgi:cell division septum initiation protein DivIVA